MFKKIIIFFVLISFLSTQASGVSWAQVSSAPHVANIVANPLVIPPILKGLKINPEAPFQLDFILDKGSEKQRLPLEQDAQRLIKYFLASLTISEKDLWVNLSPYEKDRIVPESFGQTEMGRDLLNQDYILKQISSLFLNPDKDLGKAFWAKVYEQAKEKFGTADIPVDTFNKVWIVPEKAEVFEKGNAVYVTQARLKVMLDLDYHASVGALHATPLQSDLSHELTRNILREVIIPALEKEVNEGPSFIHLRQIYASLILGIWFKDKIRETLMGKMYVDSEKIAGVDIVDKNQKNKIWEQYAAALKQGAFNFIKEEYDPLLGQDVPRKYFSGGARLDQIRNVYSVNNDAAQIPVVDFDRWVDVKTSLSPMDYAMQDREALIKQGQEELRILAKEHKEDAPYIQTLIDYLPSIISRKIKHVVSVIRNTYLFLDEKDDLLYEMLVEKNGTDQEKIEYKEMLKNLRARLPQEWERRLRLLAIFHDIGSRLDVKDWPHHVTGKNKIRALLNDAGVRLDEKDIDTLENDIYWHGSIQNVGSDFFLNEVLDLEREFKEYLFVFSLLDMSGRDGVNAATAKIMAQFKKKYEEILPELVKSGDFVAYRIGTNFSPFNEPSLNKIEGVKKYFENTRLSWKGHFVDNWAKIRVNVFDIFGRLSDISNDEYAQLLFQVSEEITALERKNRVEFSDVVLDANIDSDTDFMALPYKKGEDWEKQDYMLAISHRLKKGLPVLLSHRIDGKRLYLDFELKQMKLEFEGLREDLSKKDALVSDGGVLDDAVRRYYDGKIGVDPSGNMLILSDKPAVNIQFSLWGIRHGQTFANMDQVFQGVSDGPRAQLTPESVLKVENEAENWARTVSDGLKPGEKLVVLISPLQRAQATAMPFLDALKRLNIPYELVDNPALIEGAKERNMGDWEGKSYADVLGDKKTWGAFWRPQNGESLMDLMNRVLRWLKELNERYAGRRVVLFGHGIQFGAIKLLLGNGESLLGEGGKVDWRQVARIKQAEPLLLGKDNAMTPVPELDGKIFYNLDTGRIKFGEGAIVVPDFTLWYVRHGETFGNTMNVFQGVSDEAINQLNPTGKAQARAAAQKMVEALKDKIASGEEIVVIRSPAGRAEETSEYFIEAYRAAGGKLFVVDEPDLRQGLQEINFGDHENKTEGGPEDYYAHQYRYGLNARVRPVGGESYIDVLVRAKKWLEAVNARFKGRTVIAFGHRAQSGALRILLGDRSFEEKDSGYINWRSNKALSNAAPALLAAPDRPQDMAQHVDKNIGTHELGKTLFTMDDHGRAYTWWEVSRLNGRIKDQSVLIHVDAHDDMVGANLKPRPLTIKDALAIEYGEANFIIPAVQTGLVGEVYFVQPQVNQVYEEGSISAATGDLRFGEDRVKSDVPVHSAYRHDLPDFEHETRSIILDIDMDYFAEQSRGMVRQIWTEIDGKPRTFQWFFDGFSDEFGFLNQEDFVEAIKVTVRHFVADLRLKHIKPSIITIATSEHYSIFAKELLPVLLDEIEANFQVDDSSQVVDYKKQQQLAAAFHREILEAGDHFADVLRRWADVDYPEKSLLWQLLPELKPLLTNKGGTSVGVHATAWAHTQMVCDMLQAILIGGDEGFDLFNRGGRGRGEEYEIWKPISRGNFDWLHEKAIGVVGRYGIVQYAMLGLDHDAGKAIDAGGRHVVLGRPAAEKLMGRLLIGKTSQEIQEHLLMIERHADIPRLVTFGESRIGNLKGIDMEWMVVLTAADTRAARARGWLREDLINQWRSLINENGQVNLSANVPDQLELWSNDVDGTPIAGRYDKLRALFQQEYARSEFKTFMEKATLVSYFAFYRLSPESLLKLCLFFERLDQMDISHQHYLGIKSMDVESMKVLDAFLQNLPIEKIRTAFMAFKLIGNGYWEASVLGLKVVLHPEGDIEIMNNELGKKSDLAQNGGIDLQNTRYFKQGSEKIQLDEKPLKEALEKGFCGFLPVIINITPLKNEASLFDNK